MMVLMKMMKKDIKRKKHKSVCLEPNKLGKEAITIKSITQRTVLSFQKVGSWRKKIDKRNKERMLLLIRSTLAERDLPNFERINISHLF